MLRFLNERPTFIRAARRNRRRPSNGKAARWTYLVVRLKPDERGKLRPARERLLELACELDFGCRSANGPTCYEDAGRLWIKLKADSVDTCPLARELREGGWKQYHSDRRVFCKKSTKLREMWAVDFCERHSGEWFHVSGLNKATIDYLYRAEWCELREESTGPSARAQGQTKKAGSHSESRHR